MTRRTQGEVKWFNPEKGYGFIKASDGQHVFVAGSAVEKSQEDFMISGKKVEFKLIDDERGTFAEDIAMAG